MRQMNQSDAIGMFHLNNDSEVLKYTSDPPFKSLQGAEFFIKQYQSVYEETGLGRWSIVLKGSNEYLGWCGLKRHENGEVDLGFRFKQESWNKGYATESSYACISYFFRTFDDQYIIGRAMHENNASIRVLEKVGMNYWKDVMVDKHPAKCYKLERTEFNG